MNCACLLLVSYSFSINNHRWFRLSISCAAATPRTGDDALWAQDQQEVFCSSGDPAMAFRRVNS